MDIHETECRWQEGRLEQEQSYLFDPKNVYAVYTVDTINIIKDDIVAIDISLNQILEDT